MINLKEFKQAILQKAIQGKLTKQLPSDGNAKDLLVKIANRKRDLVQAGKLKGYSKPLPPVTSKEIPFKIPNNWEWTNLGNIGSWKSGSTPKRSNKTYYNGKIPWLKTGDLTDSYVNGTSEHISTHALNNSSLRINPIGSILIAMYGATIGKLGISNIKLTTNQACCACIPYLINNKFLFYYLLSQRNSLIRLGAGGAQPNISRTKIIHYPIPLPPLSEQQRIVLKVHKCFLLANTIQKERDLHHKFAHDMKQSLLLEAMKGHLTQQLSSDGNADDLLQKIQQKKQQLIQAGKIRKHKKLSPISKDEIPFKIPKNWKWVRLPCLLKLENGSIRRGPFGSSLRKSSFVPKSTNTYKVYEQGNAIHKSINYGNYYITDKKYKKLHSFHVKSGDIIVSGAGTIGKTYILPHNCPKGVINQALIRIRLNNNIIDTQFFLFLFDQKLGKIRRDSIGSAIKNMASIKVLKKKLVWQLPPLSEQHRIVSKLHDLFNTINA